MFRFRRPRKSPSLDLNSGMTAAVASPPPGFVSARTFPPSDVSARIAVIDWFHRCGDPFSVQLSMPVEQVDSWPEAERRNAAPGWESATLAAQNQLTLWLHLNVRSRFQEWNRHVESHKVATIDPVVARHLAPFHQARRLSQELISSTTWNLRGALMEESYRDTGHTVFFFHELLDVYEAGHCPCGWIGKWPEGKLVVY